MTSAAAMPEHEHHGWIDKAAHHRGHDQQRQHEVDPEPAGTSQPLLFEVSGRSSAVTPSRPDSPSRRSSRLPSA